VFEFLLYKIFIFIWSFSANYTRSKSERVYRTSPPRVQKKREPALGILKEGRWRFTVALGRVYKIIDFRQLRSVKPAPTEIAIALRDI
jgi:hypothetical protein